MLEPTEVRNFSSCHVATFAWIRLINTECRLLIGLIGAHETARGQGLVLQEGWHVFLLQYSGIGRPGWDQLHFIQIYQIASNCQVMG